MARTAYNITPLISYDEAMQLQHDGTQLKDCSPANFAEAVEVLVAGSYDSQALRDELADHDFTLRVDKWHCLLVLRQHRVPFEQVFKAPA
jgi:hypothetical protein